MTVLAFNYHSSIIAIMGKSNKALYTSLLSNLRCVLKLIQNRLKRLVLIIIQWNTCFFNHGFGEVALTKLR